MTADSPLSGDDGSTGGEEASIRSAADSKAQAEAASRAKAATAAAAKAAAEAAYAASGGVLRTKRPPGMVKRAVAMHVGYVGTAFQGLQVNRAGAPDSTVEAVLERAVYEAGLIAESNFGDLSKVKWSRSSRTDKGVHSVATVVGLRVLLSGDERFDEDPEGLTIAADLNARLPPQVRVFSAQRANKKFNARRFCFDRTYEYYLPAHLLLPDPPQPGQDQVRDTPGAGSPSDASSAPAGGAFAGGEEAGQEAQRQAAAVSRLRAALASYIGTYPFHNYTARRRTYAESFKDKEARKAARAAAQAEAAQGTPQDEANGAAAAAGAAVAFPEATTNDASRGETALTREHGGGGFSLAEEGLRGGLLPSEEAGGSGDTSAEKEDEADPEQEEDGPEPGGARAEVRGRGKARGKGRARDEDDPLEEEEEEEEGEGSEGASLSAGSEGEEYGTGPRSWVQSCRWLYEKSEDKRDRVTVRHFRTINSFTADDPAPLVPGGPPCVRLRVRGQSFMLHQIRHMIGGALAVARGQLPLELLAASLSIHSRLTVPRAPPHTLVLADCSFPPFRKHTPQEGAEDARVARWSGHRLELREGGQANRAAFREQSLDAALNGLLQHPDWEYFRSSLPRYHWDPQAQEEVIRAHKAFEEVRTERARQRQVVAAATAAAETAEAAEAAETVEAAEAAETVEAVEAAAASSHPVGTDTVASATA